MNQYSIEKAFENNKFRYLELLEQNIQDKIENIIENSMTLSEILINILLCKENIK
jgi:hypothetical protein